MTCEGPGSFAVHLSPALSQDTWRDGEVTGAGVCGERGTGVRLCRPFDGSVTFSHQAQGKVRPPVFKGFHVGYLLVSLNNFKLIQSPFYLGLLMKHTDASPPPFRQAG